MKVVIVFLQRFDLTERFLLDLENFFILHRADNKVKITTFRRDHQRFELVLWLSANGQPNCS